MPENYRGKHDILNEMLKICSSGAKTRTLIMYDAHISYTQLKGYLEFLVNKGLLTMDAKTEGYRITDKGNNFIQHFQEIEILLA